jgi:serine/threonine protein kinase
MCFSCFAKNQVLDQVVPVQEKQPSGPQAGSSLERDFPHLTRARGDAKLSNGGFRDAIEAMFHSKFMRRRPCSEYSHLAAAGEVARSERAGDLIIQASPAPEFLMVVSEWASWKLEGGGNEALEIHLRRGDCCRLPAMMPDGLPIDRIVSASSSACLRISSKEVLKKLGLSVPEAQAEFLLGGSILCECGEIVLASDQFCGSCGRQVDAACKELEPVDRSQLEQMSKEDLKPLGLLGCGGFSAVTLQEHRATQETFALKSLSKGYICKVGMKQAVMNEKLVLMVAASPHLTRLHATMCTDQHLHFVLEPCLGGELYATYNRKGLHGKVDHAQYYIASVAEGLAHFHSLHIIYRGANPENCLLDAKGRLKLSDVGLATFTLGKTFTTCGVPDYFSPELIQSDGHHAGTDWWSLGVMIFELLAGHPPFESAYPMQIYSKVMKGIGAVKFPPACQGSVQYLVTALLTKDALARLPLKPGGLANLREHAWFKDFQWEALLDGSLPPPYVPVVTGPNDLSNFSAREEDRPPHVHYKDDKTGWEALFSPALDQSAKSKQAEDSTQAAESNQAAESDRAEESNDAAGPTLLKAQAQECPDLGMQTMMTADLGIKCS